MLVWQRENSDDETTKNSPLLCSGALERPKLVTNMLAYYTKKVTTTKPIFNHPFGVQYGHAVLNLVASGLHSQTLLIAEALLFLLAVSVNVAQVQLNFKQHGCPKLLIDG